MAIAVQGSLDDGELAAIDKLATGVVDLAQSFLSGDDRGALDKALALNFDASELTTFALHLTQTETQAKTRVKLSGDAALAGLARIDRVFADQTKSLGEALRGLLNEPVGEIDTAARAQLAQQLLPALLAPVADATNATGAAAAA